MRAALALVAALASMGLPPVYGHSPDPATDKAAIQEIESGAFIGGSFVLMDQHGRTKTEQALLGKLSIVYFGYTYCPDICPIDAQNIGVALDILRGEPVQAFFVTLDPARDTPTRLKDWLGQFHPDFIGLTGGAERIAAVAKAFKVKFRRMEASASTDDYQLSHPGLIYLMDVDGHFLTFLRPNSDAEAIADAVRSFRKDPS